MLNTMPFRLLFNLIKNTLKQADKDDIQTGNLERRTEAEPEIFR